MYSKVMIRWDDGETYDVIIKSTLEIEPEEDDHIFFYGLSRKKLETLKKTQEFSTDGWRVEEIYQTTDNLNDLL